MIGKFKLFTKKLSTLGIIIVVIGILVLINYIFSFFSVRLDLTDNKIYSLSPATREIVGKLDDIVRVKVFFSKDIPNQLLPLRQEVESLLQAYESESGGQIRVEYIIPDTLDEEREAASLGVQKLPFTVREQEKAEVGQVFFGGAVLYGDESEPIPTFWNVSNLEYVFTAAINRLTREEVPAVAFTSGHGETTEVQLLRQLLQRDFSVRTQSVSTASADQVEIGDDLNSLLVIDPVEAWQDAEKNILNTYINEGGSVIVATEGIDVTENLSTNPVEHNLFDFFSTYGLELNKDLVLSEENENARFNTGQAGLFLQIPYPFWVRIVPEGFNQDIAAIAQLNTAVFPWVSSIELKEADGFETFSLIETAPESYTQSENINLDPSQEFGLDVETGEKIVAAAAERVLKDTGDNQTSASQPGRLILLADGDFIKDRFIQNSPANAVLLLNLVDWVASDAQLSEIRARESIYRPLTLLAKITDSVQAGIKYGTVLSVPVLVALLGTLLLLRRK